MAASSSTPKKTIAFFGASAGIGLSALKHALRQGHTCIALCRNPSRLESSLPTPLPANLTIIQGNAHDVSAVSRCLRRPDPSFTTPTPGTTFVDSVLSSIGAKPQFKLGQPLIDDANVCEKGMKTLVEAIAALQSEEGGLKGPAPHVTVLSTTGISKAGRDIPLAMVPMYKGMLKVPHEDKKALEERLIAGGSELGYRWTIVRPSLLMGGESEKEVRVGVEDPVEGKVVGEKAVGYTVSREDVGRWIEENLLEGERGARFVGRAVSVTY